MECKKRFSVRKFVKSLIFLAFSEPQEAEVRAFRGMLTGKSFGIAESIEKVKDTVTGYARGLFGKGRKLLKNLLKLRRRRARNRRRRRRVRKRRRKPNRLRLTGKKLNLNLGRRVSSWNVKLLSWNWRRYVRYGSKCLHSYPNTLKGQGHVTVNKHVISMIYIVAHTWTLCSAQTLVDGVNPHYSCF